MHLEEIVEDLQLENDRFEAKSILNRNDVIGWLSTCSRWNGTSTSFLN